MDKTMHNLIQKMFKCIYSCESISARIRSKDDVICIDTAFMFDHWEFSKDRKTLTLFGDEDVQIDFRPQELIKSQEDEDTFVFENHVMEMTVVFI